MIRRPPRSTLDRSSAASDVYKRQQPPVVVCSFGDASVTEGEVAEAFQMAALKQLPIPVSYTHLRAHETVLDLVCRLLLEKKKLTVSQADIIHNDYTIEDDLHVLVYVTNSIHL